MNRQVPREKMSKKARKKLAAEKRTVWDFSPVTRKIESKTIYNRKKISRTGYDDHGREIFIGLFRTASARDAQKNRARRALPMAYSRPKRFLKRSTRPPVSTSFCLPV